MQQCFLGVKVEMSFNGLRLEYSLEGSSNYIAWKDRKEVVLDDNGLKEFIDVDVPKPTDAAHIEVWQKKTAKCRRILLEGGAIYFTETKDIEFTLILKKRKKPTSGGVRKK